MRGVRAVRRRAIAGLGMVVLLAAACGPVEPPPPVVVGGPTDRESVAIAQAANQGEIETSQPAVQRAQSPAVREFAERMVADHTAANQRLLALGIAPQENEQSRRVTQSAREMGQALERFPPHAYDRAYIEAQIALHQYTLSMLETYLVPASRSGRLRTFLEEMQATVAAHLEQARQIRGTL